MKKTVFFAMIVFTFTVNVSAQLKVDSLGNVGIGGVIGTTNNVPVTFRSNGSLAGFTGSSGNNNVAFGYMSLSKLSGGAFNTAFGNCALLNANGTIGNTANGYNALYNNIAGNYNTAVGNSALKTNTNGNDNTAIGNCALFSSGGNGNTATGNCALYSNTSGYSNIAIGSYALYNNTTGACNTVIGYHANLTSNWSNTIAIGYGVSTNSNSQVVIGDNSVTSAKIGAIWSIPSDGRTKKNVRENVPGLDFINRLQPIIYNIDLNVLDELQKSDDPKVNAFMDSLRLAASPEERAVMAKSRADKENEVYSGFVAQDVEKAALSVGYNFNGVDAPKNGKGAYGLRYAEFVVPLVKAVQELSAKNDKLQEQVNELTELVNKLLGKDTESNSLRSGSGESSTTGLAELNDLHASLEQNVPNPFHHSTVIHYTLPETCTSAKILITNTAGSAIRQIPLSVADGTNSITIHAGSLHDGVYLYSLICDGKIVDTKRMILTK